MKRILISISFTSLLFNAIAQQSIPIKILRLDSITSFGKADGQQVTKEIDADGGTIVSDDGKLELVFPKGALSKKKKITIQPTTNLAAGGRGKTYNMEPSGLQFSKPVDIIFHYSEDETAGTLAELKGIAMQDDKGKWSMLQNVEVDSINKTITSQILHFSSYSSFDKIVLKPVSARVKVDKTASMIIQFVTSAAEETAAENKGEDYLPPLPPNMPAPEWAVNGINYGNRNVGWITNSTETVTSATFNAPASLPDDNPVAVSAHLKGLKFKFGKKIFNDLKLVSKVLIYDKAYRIKMNVWVDNSEDGQCTMRVEDYGEFTLVMEGSRTMIKEIYNQDIRVNLNPCFNCIRTWTNRSFCQGPVNTTGAKRIVVTPASLPAHPFSHVQIFLQHATTAYPIIKTQCPGSSSGAPPFPGPPPYLPPLIEFDANNENEQVLTLSELSHGSLPNNRRQGVRITITRIDE
ncbi:MAG: hypothetical protein ACJ75F_08665 [Flavisolibacter sp.]